MAALAALLIAGLMGPLPSSSDGAGDSGDLFAAVSVVVTMVLLAGRGHFRARMTPDMAGRVPVAATSVATGSSAALGVAVLTPVSAPSTNALVALMAYMILAVLAGHFVGSAVVRSLWGRGRLRARALVYGTDQLTRELAVEFGLRPDYGVDVVGFMANTRAVSSVCVGTGCRRWCGSRGRAPESGC